jgi:hypothetical protein
MHDYPSGSSAQRLTNQKLLHRPQLLPSKERIVLSHRIRSSGNIQVNDDHERSPKLPSPSGLTASHVLCFVLSCQSSPRCSFLKTHMQKLQPLNGTQRQRARKQENPNIENITCPIPIQQSPSPKLCCTSTNSNHYSACLLPSDPQKPGKLRIQHPKLASIRIPASSNSYFLVFRHLQLGCSRIFSDFDTFA